MTTSPTTSTQPPAPSTPGGTQHRKPSRRAVLGGALALVAAGGGGSAWALDRFVIPHVEISDVTAYEASQAATESGATPTEDAAASAAVVSANSFTSAEAALTITPVTTGTGNSTVNYFVAKLNLTTATALKSAFANNSFGENITANTSTIAAGMEAIFAINGDYYGFRDTGIVIRNGVAYRDKGAREGLAFYRDGTVEVYDETTTSAERLLASGVWHTLSFGPSLLDNGTIIPGIENIEVDTNFGNHSIQGLQPRTAVGVLGTNQLVFVVVDGRSTGYSAGVSMNQLAAIMLKLGATTAYNLDGGGSSTMYFNGGLVNNPLGKNQERGTSDILYVAA